jgi:hypothetical protein
LELDWTHRPIHEWRALLRAAPRANWLQTITLAKVLKDHLAKFTRVAAIIEDSKPVGMVTIQEIHLGPFQLVEIYRGPIWFVEDPSEQWLFDFAQLLAKEYPRSLLRRRRWLPEWSYSERAVAILRSAGFRSRRRKFETSWIDLKRPINEIRQALDKKWRNSLNKGERFGLDIRVDRTGSSADAFAEYHAKEQERKKYRGRSQAFLKDEIIAAATFKEVLILWALLDNEPIAGVLIVMHGTCGSYRAGWTTEDGRKHNAHNVMLWDAIETLQQEGYCYLDVGGTVSGRGTVGLTQFKRGLGGQDFKTLGVFG